MLEFGAISLEEMAKEMEIAKKQLKVQERALMVNLARNSQKMAKAMFGTPYAEWPLLSDWTIRTHEEHEAEILSHGRIPPDTPLLVTGKLRDSVRRKSGQTWAETGTNDERMLVHEFGAPNHPVPRGGHTPAAIPPRPVFKRVAEDMHDRMGKEVDGTIGRVFGGKASFQGVQVYHTTKDEAAEE